MTKSTLSLRLESTYPRGPVPEGTLCPRGEYHHFGVKHCEFYRNQKKLELFPVFLRLYDVSQISNVLFVSTRGDMVPSGMSPLPNEVGSGGRSRPPRLRRGGRVDIPAPPHRRRRGAGIHEKKRCGHHCLEVKTLDVCRSRLCLDPYWKILV